MSLLFMDSFDHYLTADLTEKYLLADNSSIQASQGRRTTAAVSMSGGSWFTHPKALTIVGNTGIMGAAFRTSSFNSQGDLMQYRSGSTVQCSLGINQAGLLTVWRGGVFNTLLATAPVPTAVGANVYHFIESKIVIHPSTGSVIIRINGVEVINITGVNTAQTGVAGYDNVRLTAANNSHWDDFYVLDGNGAAPWNDFLGDIRVDARYPTANGATVGFTPSTGSNFQTVDEVTPNDDTDFNSTITLNAIDTFVVQDSPVVGGTILGVQHNISAKKADAGPASLAAVIRHSGVDNVGASVALGTNYSYMSTIYQVNPGTGVAWTEADFNAAEFGYKKTV